MLIFKLTVLESVVLLLNSPGHLRVEMTSAHQAGVLELIFKKKSRGLKAVKKKAAQTIARREGFAENKRDQRVGLGRPEKTALGWGRRWMLTDEEYHVGAELTFCPSADVGNSKAKRGAINLKKSLS